MPAMHLALSHVQARVPNSCLKGEGSRPTPLCTCAAPLRLHLPFPTRLLPSLALPYPFQRCRAEFIQNLPCILARGVPLALKDVHVALQAVLCYRLHLPPSRFCSPPLNKQPHTLSSPTPSTPPPHLVAGLVMCVPALKVVHVALQAVLGILPPFAVRIELAFALCRLVPPNRQAARC